MDKISIEEIAAVFPTLELSVRQAIVIGVLKHRLDLKDLETERLKHHVEILEQANKMPDGYQRANNGEVLEMIKEYA